MHARHTPEELGFQLFERQGRSLVRTTEAGEDIIARVASTASILRLLTFRGHRGWNAWRAGIRN
jgi:DNA-binding transcriptional LysR family regulator